MGTRAKVALPAVRVKQETIDKLRIEAEKENRTFSNHIDTVLTNHVNKESVSNYPA
jgi:DNA-directed RNA polymerase subunit L